MGKTLSNEDIENIITELSKRLEITFGKEIHDFSKLELLEIIVTNKEEAVSDNR